MATPELPLGSVISALRSEITAAAKAAKGKEVQFEVGPIELELSFTAKKEGGPKAKIKFNVLSVGAEVGAEGSISREHVQKVKITLSPLFLQPDGTKRPGTFLMAVPHADWLTGLRSIEKSEAQL